MFDTATNRSSFLVDLRCNAFSLDSIHNLPDSSLTFPRANHRSATSLHHDFSVERSVQAIKGQSAGASWDLSDRFSSNVLRTTKRSHRADVDGITGIRKGGALASRIHATESRTTSMREGSLDFTDHFNPTRLGSFKDDYLLNRSTGGVVKINMNSSWFDAYVQVVNSQTGTVIAFDDDSGGNGNAQLSLKVEAGVDYIVRATSFDPYETGRYSISANSVSTPVPTPTPAPTPAPTPTPTPRQFNSVFGYGLVNAAAAVARGVNASPFSDVADLGGNLWGNDLIKAPEVWARGYTGRNIVVAVVDSGVDYNHSDLNENIWTNTREVSGNGIDDDRNGFIDDVRGWNFVTSNSSPMDDVGHGTHVAGTIAAENNGSGATGVAYGATIMPVKVLGSNGTGSNLNVARGIRYAADNGANVINLSLGSSVNSTEVESAIEYAVNKGSFVVMAAGNSGMAGGYQPDYPAYHATRWGLSVGAVDRNRSVANFSNRAGTNSQMQHVMAPGKSIYSTLPINQYGNLDGTSMATPHVAGVVALMLSANPNLTQSQVRQIVTETAISDGITSSSRSGLSRARVTQRRLRMSWEPMS